MTLTPTEAADQAAAVLRGMYTTVTDWDTALFDQVVLHLADSGQPFGMNQIRHIVPDDACRRAGLYFHALVGHDSLHPDQPALLRRVGDQPSINPKAHGKRVNLYRLTPAGRRHIEARQAARKQPRQQGSAAA
ncbi:hypothetical protein [Streptomyces smyrnaeus]|uniref:hypothetical protein n=1 Tax=Streptomyces smyrnaeus TaxID=1387713 RepID=UPI0033DDEAE4